MRKQITTCLVCLFLSLACVPFVPSVAQQGSPTTANAQPATSSQISTHIPATHPLSTVALPSLPEFDQVLTFGGAGGGADSCGLYDYQGPVPAVIGKVNFDSYRSGTVLKTLPRLAELCLWGVPTDQPFSVTLTSPDGTHTLKADFRNLRSASGDEAWNWAEKIRGNPAGGVTFWWPGNLPNGIWHIEVKWQEKRIAGEFDSRNKDLPEIFLEEEDAHPELQPLCHSASSQAALQASGYNFPVNSPVYALLYERDPSSDAGPADGFSLVWRSSIVTDNLGYFRTKLPYQFKSGVLYQLFGVEDPKTQLADQIWNGGIHAFDCFTAPVLPTESSCIGALPQRLVVGQSGYACTQEDRVNIRNGPGKSAGSVGFLNPGDDFYVAGGPDCAEGQSWWQIDNYEGIRGWVSEGGDEVDPYFVCPDQMGS